MSCNTGEHGVRIAWMQILALSLISYAMIAGKSSSSFSVNRDNTNLRNHCEV